MWQWCRTLWFDSVNKSHLLQFVASLYCQSISTTTHIKSTCPLFGQQFSHTYPLAETMASTLELWHHEQAPHDWAKSECVQHVPFTSPRWDSNSQVENWTFLSYAWSLATRRGFSSVLGMLCGFDSRAYTTSLCILCECSCSIFQYAGNHTIGIILKSFFSFYCWIYQENRTLS